MLFLAVVCTGIAYMMYFDLIGKLVPPKRYMVIPIVPVFGLIWGWWLLNETISHLMLLGAVVIAGVMLTAVGLIGHGNGSTQIIFYFYILRFSLHYCNLDKRYGQECHYQ